MTDFNTDGPLAARVRFHSGELFVEATGTDTARATVEAMDPSDHGSVEIARSARIELNGRHLVVDVPGKWRRSSHVRVTLLLPSRSSLESQSGDVVLKTTGELADLKVRTGSCDVQAPTVGTVDIKAGDAEVLIGRASTIAVTSGRANLRAGSAVDVSLKAGHGSADLKATSGQVVVRGGGVALTLHEASGGEVHFEAGMGSAHVGVREGTTVQLDLTSSLGDVRCDLPMEAGAPQGGAALKVKLKTGSGDVVVSTSVRQTA
ncbi:MAG: hypothetical protein JWO12_1336 [Frankiales bacterium]|nr:hypothetical protein [Frankiales bacterium]